MLHYKQWDLRSVSEMTAVYASELQNLEGILLCCLARDNNSFLVFLLQVKPVQAESHKGAVSGE